MVPSAPTDQPRVLAIGGGGAAGHVRDWSARLVSAARRRGLALEVADSGDDLKPLRHESHVRTHELDFTDAQAAEELALAVAKIGTTGGELDASSTSGTSLVGVTSFRELGVLSAATAAERVGLPWNTPASIATVRHKNLCRRRLREAGLAQPESRAFGSPEDALAFMRSDATGGPWVVKPSSSLGSQGVRMVADLAAAREALAAAARFGLPILVEELVEGLEISAEGVFVAGEPHVIAFTRKEVGSAPYFVSVGQSMPAEIDAGTSARATSAVQAALRAVGLTHSVFHVELWVTPTGEVVLGEMHARPGGDWIHLLVDRCYGVDMIDVAVGDIVGDRDKPRSGAAVHAAAVAAVTAKREGVLKRLDGLEELESDPRCIVTDVKALPGARVGKPSTHYGRLALVVAHGSDSQSATQAARELADSVQVVLA